MSKYLEFEKFIISNNEFLFRVKQDNFNFIGRIEKIDNKYCFISNNEQSFTSNCLKEIANFLDKLNKEHGEKK